MASRSAYTLRRKLAFFIVVSMALHLALVFVFILPGYLATALEARRAAEAGEQARQRAEAATQAATRTAQDARRQESQQAAEEARQQLVSELHDNFQSVVGDQLQGPEAEQTWSDLLAQLTASLDDYSHAMADGQASDAELRRGMNELQATMLQKLSARLSDKSATDLRNAFLARVETDVAPKLIEFYRRQLQTRIGDALRDEASKIVRQDADDIREQVRAGRDVAEKDKAEPELRARTSIKRARDADLKDLISRSFWETYTSQTAPRLEDKLTRVFRQALEEGGIKDESAVADVAKRVHAALVDQVHDKMHAGEAGTDPLSAALHLDQIAATRDGHSASPGPRNGSTEPRNPASTTQGSGPADDTTRPLPSDPIADRVGKVARELVHSRMNQLAGDAGDDDANIAAIMGKDAPKHTDGDGDDPAGSAGLAARIARLAENIKSGRTELSDTIGAGGSMGGGAVARGGGIGTGGSHLNMLERFHGVQLRNRAHYVDQAEYARLTAGIAERDRLAAQGQAMTRRSAEDQPASGANADEISRTLRPAALLIPPQPRTDPVGKPDSSVPFKPAFKTLRFAAIPYRSNPVTIDGDLSEWKDVPALDLAPATESASAKPELKRFPQAVKVQWDDSGFYLAYDVKDADNKITKAKPGNFWEGDGIEFWVDTLNTKEKFRSRCTHQFWVWVDGAEGDPTVVGGEAQQWKGRDEYCGLGKDIIKAASKRTEAGWTLEAFIPASQFRMLDLQPGRILGVNFSICTGTDLYYYWAGTTAVATARRPDTWGDVLLAGSAGRLECVDELAGDAANGQAAKAVNSVSIGVPIRIRVTDPDMNLSEKIRDRVAVTVSTRRGANRLVVLEETGLATGIFEGSIPTCLDDGRSAPGVLPLLDGDNVDLVYNDQCRPDGARDVKVKLTLPTAASITDVSQK